MKKVTVYQVLYRLAVVAELALLIPAARDEERRSAYGETPDDDSPGD